MMVVVCSGWIQLIDHFGLFGGLNYVFCVCLFGFKT